MQNSKPVLTPIDIDVTRLPSKGRRIKFVASDEEKKRVRAEFDLQELDRLEAQLVVVPWRRDGVEINGRISAKFTQLCVVTLEPLPQEIAEDLSLIFVPEGSPLAKPEIDTQGELVIDPNGADMPETYSGTTLDVSQTIVEMFALAVDPYPRSANVSLPDKYAPDPALDEQPKSPFAVLEKLRTGK